MISGSIVLLSGSTLVILINLAYNVGVAHFLGSKGFGNANAVYTILTLVSAVTLSFQITTAKVIAQHSEGASRDAAYRDFHRTAWLAGITVASLLILFQRQITSYLDLSGTHLVTIIAVGAAFYVPLGSRRGYIQGAYGFRTLATNLVFEGIARLAGSLAMVALGFGVSGVVAANSAAILIAYLTIAPKHDRTGSNPLTFDRAFSEVSHSTIFFAGQVLINNCDIVLVKHYFASSEAGLYAAIAMVGRVTFACSTAVINGMFPVIAGTKREERNNLSLLGTALLLIITVGTVLATGLRYTPDWMWTTLFGSSFYMTGIHSFPYLLSLYATATMVYCVAVVVMTYEMSYKIGNTSWYQLLFSGVLITGICKYHDTLSQVILVQLVLLSAFLVVITIPFCVSAHRSHDSESRSIRFVRSVSEDAVIAAFLQSDFDNTAYERYHDTHRRVVFTPDLDDQSECSTRRALLASRHRALWNELPKGTSWFEVEIESAHLVNIRAFPRAQWTRIAWGNVSITQIVERLKARPWNVHNLFIEKISHIREHLSEDDFRVGFVLLIGQSGSGVLTVLDGNHRLVAAMLEGKVGRLKFICGLSPQMTQCCWYRTNLFNLIRYGSHLLRHLFQYPNQRRLAVSDELGRLPD